MKKKFNIQDLEFEGLPSFDQVMTKLGQRPKHLLLGNGFSMAYDPKIFSYNALHSFIEDLKDPILDKLFAVVNTKNFELVMKELDNFIELAKAFNQSPQFISELEEANIKLQNSLIEAVTSLHPEHVFEMPEEKANSCFDFINMFIRNGGKVFSTNYDLLLYWVLMRYKAEFAIDGFGKELLNPEDIKYGEEQQWSDLYWGKNKENQTVFHLHGTLPIFDTGIEIEKETYNSQRFLLEGIKKRMDRKNYPVFVTAGDGRQKMEHIMHNKYLTYCYEELSSITGSLITFGFNFGQYDYHIIDAINKAAKHGARTGGKLLSIYIGVYSESDLIYIKSIEDKFECKVNVFNSQTANIWDKYSAFTI